MVNRFIITNFGIIKQFFVPYCTAFVNSAHYQKSAHQLRKKDLRCVDDIRSRINLKICLFRFRYNELKKKRLFPSASIVGLFFFHFLSKTKANFYL